MTRVLIVDDHGILRAGLRLVLERASDLTVVGEAADGREAVDWIAEHDAEVVVMDVAMPGLNGVEAAAQILRRRPACRVVMLSMHNDETYVLRCLRAGACGYVLKESAEGELIDAIRATLAGRSYFSPKVQRLLREEHVEQLRRAGADDAFETLTEREREVLQLIAEGNTNKEIAGRLFLSVLTVETHRKKVLEKLGARGTPELVLYAVRRGLVC
jgi:two-component system, NarL family, response regulator NreC